MTDESAWPPGRGEMAGKVRSFDWSTTPLGPISSWRPELRTAAAFVLDTAFPAALVWGDARVTLYNDAFVPILGDKPEALGRSFAEIWSEAWSEEGSSIGHLPDKRRISMIFRWSFAAGASLSRPISLSATVRSERATARFSA